MNSHPLYVFKFLFTFSALLCIGCSTSNKDSSFVPEVEITKALIEDVPINMEFVGQVYGLYDIPIRARVEGYVEGRSFDEGMPVTKGQLLYKIDPQPFEAAVAEKLSNLAVAQTNNAHAETELKRIEPLAKRNAVSQSELDGAIALRDASIASVEAAQANLSIANINLSYTEIRSPINGIIGKTKARVGEFVGKNPNPVILNTVSRIDTVRVQFFITESNYLTFARANRARLDSISNNQIKEKKDPSLELILADGTTHNHMGSIDFIDREVDASTGAILLEASFPNPDKLIRPGQYAKVKATASVIEDGILVPMRSVKELQGQYSVFVVTDSSTVEARSIIVGQKLNDMWLVVEGLEGTEKVVTNGIQKIRSGIKVNATEVKFNSQAAKK